LANLLIENGADVDVKEKIEDTPLHAQRLSGKCQLLIDFVADANPKSDNGKTPLHRV